MMVALDVLDALVLHRLLVVYQPFVLELLRVFFFPVVARVFPFSLLHHQQRLLLLPILHFLLFFFPLAAVFLILLILLLLLI